ncbi:alkanesulfonate monooxygenase SsuD/methylene tetrahydromethanopterin reductase-like flavin-dependent oxidoreductase (luciferase family) [Streptomyces sp. Ag109_G2-6]|uniref:LLM class flavin-dependent oxidoreductase n=1 Tax=Streptomyces TaxID=1883 RepID=UPI0009A4A08C|nr:MULTISPECIES: LLM class flavin-dependent oxidoreductase [Streptomyces]RPF29337.1 alkanesulfonate monooxygenase SsuD/methylene tetrahydromethanopterin reductase-like flavin-dependent oxidoreductase (luciferase family) [Streptomyces sp. Ag109_G2-6]
MKFSVIFEAQLADPTVEREHQVIRDCVEQAVFAERMGFDRIWAVEHHSLKWYAHMSAPEVFLSWVAARTNTIRIGHGVVCMPFGFNHPVRVAERAAMLDLLSGGRVDLGAGRGGTLQETSLCGVDRDRTEAEVEEALRIIGSAWREEELEYHGELIDIGPHPVLPRPAQAPHPPLFLACSRAETLVKAAELGVGALVMGFAGPESIAGMRAVYDTARAERDGSRFVSGVVNDHFSVLCPTIVLDDPGEARRIGIRGQRFFAQAIGHWYGGAGVPDEAVVAGADEAAELRRAAEQVVARLHEQDIPVRPASTATFNAGHAYGSADEAIAYVERLREAGADEVMCLVQMGTVPQEACLETLRQWGEKVIPHFRAGVNPRSGD